MAKETLCASCKNSIFCQTWAEWKCKKYEKRIHSYMSKCGDYDKRPSGFKEPKCQCEDCLENELLTDEEDAE